MPQELYRDAPQGAVQAGIEPFRLLQAILDNADVIALDVPERGRSRKVHLLATLPVKLLDRAMTIAAYDVDDEDNQGDEPDTDAEPDVDDEPSGNMNNSADEEASLGFPDGLIDQSRQLLHTISVGNTWQSVDGDEELDPAETEPSLGSLDGQIDQTNWAAGDRLDRERGASGRACDDDEDNGDLEPDCDDEPDDRRLPTTADDLRLGGVATWADAATANTATFAYSEPVGPVHVWLPTGNGDEMRNAKTGETGRWKLLPRHGASS